jgi:hypothetical protein
MAIVMAKMETWKTRKNERRGQALCGTREQFNLIY